MELSTAVHKSGILRALFGVPAILLILVLGTLPAQNVALLPPETIDPAAIPFQEGEEVRYSIHWKPLFLFPAFKAGELRLKITRSQYLKEDAYQISAWATSEGLLKKVAGLDVRDYFESIVTVADFGSRRYRHQSRHNQRKRDVEVIFDYPGDRMLVREVDVAVNPPRMLKEENHAGLPGLMLDALSVFYAARLQELQPGQEFRLFLLDGNKIKTVDLAILQRDKVKVDLGKFDTVKISTRGGMFRKGGDFRIWYTRDDLRIPVKFEADVSFGKLYGELVQLQTPQYATSVVKVP